MLKQKHFYYDKIYTINTIVGKIEKDAIEEITFIGYTKLKPNAPKSIIYYNNIEADEAFHDISDELKLFFDTKEDAEKYVGYYNNGTKFIKPKGVKIKRKHKNKLKTF